MNLNPNTPTLTEVLGQKGYETVQVTANPVTTHIFGLDRGFDRVERSWKYFGDSHQPALDTILMLGKRRIRKKVIKGDFITGKMTEDLNASKSWFNSFADQQMARSIEILEQNKQNKRPTFLFINLMETHFPYHIDQKFKTLSPGIFSKANELKSLYHMVNQSWLKTGKRYISPYMLDLLKRRQHLAWKRLSEKIDGFFKLIRELFPNTLFIFGADHGDNFGDEGWRYHFSNLTEAGTRIPLFVAPPDNHKNHEINNSITNRRIFDYIVDFSEQQADYTPLFKSQSVPMLQSFWYDMHGETHPQYQFDQFAFIHDNYRYVENQIWKKYKVEELTKKFPESEKIDGNPVFDLALSGNKRATLASQYKNFKSFSRHI